MYNLRYMFWKRAPYPVFLAALGIAFHLRRGEFFESKNRYYLSRAAEWGVEIALPKFFVTVIIPGREQVKREWCGFFDSPMEKGFGDLILKLR